MLNVEVKYKIVYTSTFNIHRFNIQYLILYHPSGRHDFNIEC